VDIGAKTLSGYSYIAHAFWDTEIFMLPFFIHTRPEIARNLLSYRWHNLPGAREKARANGFRGAQYPWESAGTGEEVTPTWVPNPADRTSLIRIWTGDIESISPPIFRMRSGSTGGRRGMSPFCWSAAQR
jgi:kojibiose phosphorylase